MQRSRRWATRYILILGGVSVQILFFISAFHTGWFNSLFSGEALHHCCQGLDFYQVPNGAYAFWHGGSLSGKPLPNGATYAQGHIVNLNVYHPLFTLLVGTPLLLLKPEQAFYAWMVLNFLLWFAVVAYFFWSFRNYRYIGLACFILLADAELYLEMALSQFQGMLDVLLLLFLIALVKHQSKRLCGVLYFLILLVKPIGFLWIVALLCKRQFTVVFIGGLLFIAATTIFFFAGSYYLKNLATHLFSPTISGPNQIITLLALLHYSIPSPGWLLKALKYAALGFVLFCGTLKRIPIAKGIFLAIVYYLLFYDLTYEYQWACLPASIAVCLVYYPEFQTRFSRLCILLTCLPSAFFLLNLWHINTTMSVLYGTNPGKLAWQWMVVSKITPVLLLVGSVLARDFRPILRDLRTFISAMWEVNQKLEIFG